MLQRIPPLLLLRLLPLLILPSLLQQRLTSLEVARMPLLAVVSVKMLEEPLELHDGAFEAAETEAAWRSRSE